MGCCGQATGRLSISQADIDDGLRLGVEYTGGRTVRVTGAVTGDSYTFSGVRRVQEVDPRDAAAILKDSRFRLKGVTRPQDRNRRPTGT